MLVGELLDRGGRDARRAEAVGAHPDQLLLAGLVEVGGAQRLRVAGAELEDVADLDRRLDPDRSRRRPCRPVDDGPDVDALEREVAARLDAAQVRVGPVGAGHIAARARRRSSSRIGTSAPTGPMNPGGPERAATSSGCAARNVAAERVRELDLVDAVVAAHDTTSFIASPSTITGNALSSAPGGHAELPGDGVDRRHPGRVDLLGRVERRAAARPAGRRRSRPRRWPRSRARARRRSRPPRTAPCTRARRCRPSSRRRTRPGTTPARSGRRSGRRRRRACRSATSRPSASRSNV